LIDPVRYLDGYPKIFSFFGVRPSGNNASHLIDHVLVDL
jgi:hypothetical protein